MQAMQFEPQLPTMPVALPNVPPQMSVPASGPSQVPQSLTGSVGMPKTPTGRRPSLDLEYELFRDTGGQVPELSQPTKMVSAPAPMSLTDSFPASNEFLLDLHGGGAATPPMRSPTGLSVPIPFQGAGPRRPSLEMPFLQSPPLISASSFAFPPQPHGAPLSGSAAPDSGVQSPPPSAQSQASHAFRPQTRLVSAQPPAMRAPPSKPAAPQYSSLPSSPEPQSPRKKGMPAEEKARVRAEQSRTSSRLYRLRKKAYQQSLESTIDGLKSDNSQLRKELDAAKETIAKLQSEIANLKESKA